MEFEKRKRGVLLAALLLCAAGISLYTGYTIVKAAFREEEAVHIEDPASIENATLLIGTHLIYLGSINEELYKIAADSASDAEQSRIYYKSELADGAWFDITDASSVAEISTQGMRVSEEEIRALFVTHHTRSDGITYDLRTNQTVCIFDIYPVYDLEHMPELEALKMQYDLMKEAGSDSATAKRNLRFVRDFFALHVSTEETDTCDIRLNALQQYYEQLTMDQANTSVLQQETETVISVMEKISNSRKVTVFALVSHALEELQFQIQDAGSVENEEETTQYDMDDVLLTAIGNSISAVMESMTAAEGNLLEEGDIVLAKTEYDLSMDLIAHAISADFVACDTDNGKLGNLKNIGDGMIVNREAELALADEMIGRADEKYRADLAQGISADYQTTADQKSSHAVLDSIKKQDIAKTNAIRSEMQFLIQARVMRQEEAAAETYIIDRIKNAGSFRDKVKDDDYAGDKRDTVAAYIRWLEALLKDIKSGGSDLNEEEKLREQKAALQEQKLAALDQEDLDTAKKLDAQMERIDAQISDLEAAGEKLLSQLQESKTALEQGLRENPADAELLGQLAEVNAAIAEQSLNLADAGMASGIMGLKADAMEGLANEETDAAVIGALEAAVNGLEGFLESGSPLALAALKEVYQKMAANAYLYDTRAYDALMASIEESITGSDITELVVGGMSSDTAVAVIEKYMGGTLPFSDDDLQQKDLQQSEIRQDERLQNTLHADDLAAALLALAEYADDTNSRELASLTAGLAAAVSGQAESHVFQSETQDGESYVPADLLAEYAGFRYVWNDTRKTAVLSRGRTFYSFTAFDSEVGRESGNQEYMETPARFQGTVYLPVSYVKDVFLCGVIDITGTDYSVLVNDRVTEISQEILAELCRKGGESWELQ